MKKPINKPELKSKPSETKTSVKHITIDAEYAGQRIDNFLITFFKSLPKTRVYRILRKGEVRVNKKRVDPSYRLQENDDVRIPPVTLSDKPPIEHPSKKLTELLKSRILFEDKNLLIINKPAGIPVHGGTGVKSGVVEALRQIFPELKHLELVHRLDLDTSGCLMLAKKRSVLREIHELLREGKVEKNYLALTKGHWKPKEYRVEVPLRKNHLKSGERIVTVDPEGKESITIFEPQQEFAGATLVKAKLLTGRTHQIRVHAQYRKHQIAGDEKYGDKEFNKKMRDKGLKRLFLHSYTLKFTLPSLSQKINVRAELDEELNIVLKKL